MGCFEDRNAHYRNLIQVLSVTKHFSLAIIICILVISAALAVIWTSSSMEAEIARRVGSSLETVLNTMHEDLRTCEQQTRTNIAFIANSPGIRAAVTGKFVSGTSARL